MPESRPGFATNLNLESWPSIWGEGIRFMRENNGKERNQRTNSGTLGSVWLLRKEMERKEKLKKIPFPCLVVDVGI